MAYSIGNILTAIRIISALGKDGTFKNMDDSTIGVIADNLGLECSKKGDLGQASGLSKVFRNIIGNYTADENEHTESEEEKASRLKLERADAQRVGKERTMGMIPRLVKTGLDTLGDATQMLGDTSAAAMAVPYAGMAAAGMSMPQTEGDKVLGTPNMGGTWAALSGAQGAVSPIVAHGAGALGNKLLTGVGNDIAGYYADRQMQENLYSNMQDMTNWNINPSQARIGERYASANTFQRRQATNGGKY